MFMFSDVPCPVSAWLPTWNVTILQYKAQISVPDCPGPERILTLCSSEIDTIISVINEVLPNLEDTSGRGKNGDEVDLRMLVHQSQAGCIIGKQGLKIKELREKTGARIKIYTNCCPQSTDRVVQVTGRNTTCTDCVKEMLILLKTVPVKGVDNPYDPINFDDVYADEYGGYGGGSGGGRRGGGGMGMGGGDMGGPMGGGRGGGRGPAPFNRGNMGGPPRGQGGFGSGGGGGGFGGGGNRNGFRNDNDNGPDEGMGGGRGGSFNSGETQVTIPKDLAGAIIGKGGTRIQRIRSESGAGITIEDAVPGSNDRIITISGQPNQIQMAQYLLQQSVHQNTNQARNNRY